MYRLIVGLLSPYIVLWLLTGLAIANLWRRRREGRRHLLLVTLPYLVLTIISLPVVCHLALGTLEWQYRPLHQRPADAGAIVVLGGSVLPADAYRARAELGRGTYDRCQYAIQIYRQGESCPVLVSGGRVDPAPSTPTVGFLMGEFLRSHGVRPDDIIVEDRSLSTHENAIESSKDLQARGIRKVVLVTEAMHMARAEAAFRRQGVEVIAAPCSFRASNLDWSAFDFLPNPKAALAWLDAWHEWLGLAWYWLHGRI